MSTIIFRADKTSGIVTTKSDAYLKSIKISGFSSTKSTYNLRLFVRNEPYDSIQQMYVNNYKESHEYKITSDTIIEITDTLLRYVGIRSYGGGITVENIIFNWYLIDYKREVQIGDIGTICLPYSIDSDKYEGAIFYEINYVKWENDQPYKVMLDEVKILEAGIPYIYEATKDSMLIAGKNDNVEFAGSSNGLYGTFEEIIDGAAGTITNTLENNYIISNGTFCKCGEYCGLMPNRAYMIIDEVSTIEKQYASPRRHLILSNNKETNLDHLNIDIDNHKIMINGNFYIIKNDKIYDIFGNEIYNL